MNDNESNLVYAKNNVPIWRKFCLSVDEAAEYFHLGEERLRRLQKENPQADYLLNVGNRCYFKRRQFEDFIDGLSCI